VRCGSCAEGAAKGPEALDRETRHHNGAVRHATDQGTDASLALSMTTKRHRLSAKLPTPPCHSERSLVLSLRRGRLRPSIALIRNAQHASALRAPAPVWYDPASERAG